MSPTGETTSLITPLQREGGEEERCCTVSCWKAMVITFLPASISACTGGVSPLIAGDSRNTAITLVVVGFVTGVFAMISSCYGCTSTNNYVAIKLNAAGFLAGAFGIGFSIWGAVELG